MEWMTIDTSPKNEDVLVCYDFATVPIVHVARYDTDEHDQWEQMGFESKDKMVGWWSYVENSVSQHKLEGPNAPTHWMPLFKWPKSFWDSRYQKDN